jgi:hypothetical protein
MKMPMISTLQYFCAHLNQVRLGYDTPYPFWIPSYLNSIKHKTLTKTKHCRFGRGKQSDASASEDDEFVSDWNFFGGDLGDYNQHYGKDQLDRLHATGDEMDILGHHGVTT